MNFLDILKSALLGIVQGITEWFPVSSTGHMILFNEFIHLRLRKDFLDLFLVLIQLASIFAVVFLYFRRLNPLKRSKGKIRLKKDTMVLWSKIIVGCLPLVLGAALDDFVHEKLYNSLTVSITLIFYGLVFIAIEKSQKKPLLKKTDQVDYKTAFLVGLFQILAIVPGTSRSGATIIGALALGFTRTLATEFSFFLAIPTMFGASFYKTLKYILKFGLDFSLPEILILLVGFASSFIVSVFSIKFFTGYIKKKSFSLFGYYRIVLGVFLIFYFFALRSVLT